MSSERVDQLRSWVSVHKHHISLDVRMKLSNPGSDDNLTKEDVSLKIRFLDTIPYLTMPCHGIPYHTWYHIKPYHTKPPYLSLPYHAMPCHPIPYHTTPYHNAPHHIMPARKTDAEERLSTRASNPTDCAFAIPIVSQHCCTEALRSHRGAIVFQHSIFPANRKVKGLPIRNKAFSEVPYTSQETEPFGNGTYLVRL